MVKNDARFPPESRILESISGYNRDFRSPTIIVETTLLCDPGASWGRVDRLFGFEKRIRTTGQNPNHEGMWRALRLVSWLFDQSRIPVFEEGIVVGQDTSKSGVSVCRSILPHSPGQPTLALKAFNASVNLIVTAATRDGAGQLRPPRNVL
ncbi:MAG: hypothetical protein DWQ08_09265, partial [Proteobacteria bacterium]